jgi:hypothetical protein
VKIIKACKIISDMLPNPFENYQIEENDNINELVPKLIKNISVLRKTVGFYSYLSIIENA